ncbi:GNAT family N-acetyltransferase [Pantoea sp. 1.19]|uniref:GNAT family N-acetyltransferase n=1 Tax=Pantoea sp. 1.19 TaxID=1925589 RepID=UPI000948B6F2|nr:GNAT family N-acetyltransferase [Pantoea sp. 1.19]
MQLISETNQHPLDVDLPALARLLQRGGLGERAPDALERSYQHSQYRWFGWQDNRLIATAHAITDFTWSAYVSDIVVDPDDQGRGYGDRLMQAILRDLAPVSKLFIYAVPDKVAFYQRWGCRPLATAMVYADGPALTRLQQGGYLSDAR